MSGNRDGGGRGRGRGQRGGAGFSSGPPRGSSPSGQSGYRGRGGGGGPPGGGGSGDVFGGPPSVDLRLTASGGTQALLKTLQTIPHDPARPTRPGFGTLGKAGVLRTNFFPVKFPKNGVIYDYHVDFSPTTDLRSIKSRLFTMLEQSAHPGWREYIPFIAHDGTAKLVSSKKLPQPLDIPILFLKEGQTKPGKQDKTYTVSIVFNQELKYSDLDA